MIRTRTTSGALRLAVLAALCGAAVPASAQSPALPPARQLIERHAQAIGGREKVAKLSSVRISAEMEMPAMGIRGPIEVYMARPNRSYSRMVMGAAGEISTGFDGSVGWMTSAIQGPRLVEGAELEQMRENADFAEMITQVPEPAGYASIETVERTEMGGRPCYKVKLVRRSGRVSYNCYDVETGLLVGMVRTRESEMGKMEIPSVLSDYREFGGIRMATRTVSTMMGQQMVATTKAVELDTVEPSRFELPQEIRALVGAGGAKPRP